MEVKDKITIATDFSINPGSRYKADGSWSGEQFLEEVLKPKFEKAVKENYILLIDLDKVFGYPTSFISGSFGLLSQEKGSDILLKHIKFKSDENALRLTRIINEIKNPIKKVI